jgi:hypothetical protein
MIKRRLWTALMAGIAVLMLMHALYVLVLLDAQKYELLRLMLLAFPVLGAFLVAYLAPHRKFVSAMSMSLFGATIGVVSLPIYELAGLQVDSVGGLSQTFIIFLSYHAATSALGALGGILVARAVEKRNA